MMTNCNFTRQQVIHYTALTVTIDVEVPSMLLPNH